MGKSIKQIEQEVDADIKQLLVGLYCEKQLSQPVIANILDYDQGNLSRLMKRLGVVSRSYTESQRLYWASGADTSKQRANLKSPKTAKYKYPLNLQLVQNLYWGMGIGIPKIAKILNIPEMVIYMRLKRSGMTFRPRNKRLLGRARPDVSKRNRTLKFQRKMAEVLSRKPNKIELYLNSLLQRHFPKEWEYSGDGKIIIGGLCPDFVNCNGQKKLIELFGDYWHSPERKGIKLQQTEQGRKEVYSKFGFDMLVIWEHELKNLPEEQIITKIKTFSEAM